MRSTSLPTTSLRSAPFVTAAIIACTLLVAGPASAATAPVSAHPAAASAKVFKNCTELNKTYKHGVGKKGAKDHVSGSSKPVTNFAVNTAVYNANKKSDRDKDGIACEKR